MRKFLLIALVAGFTPKVGPAISIAFTFSSLYSNGTTTQKLKNLQYK